HRAERLLIAGQLLPAEQAVKIGLVDELVDGELVTARALAWLQELQQLPRQPMLTTRAIARADLRAALAPELIQLERFVDGCYAPDAQTALHGLVARLQKA
ncbi:enoyl-CoA hydratase, partial [Xanthomonas oryzae pv. oryzae]